MQQDTAIAMWQLLFADDRQWPLLDSWCGFLEAHHNRAVSRDTWVQLFEFIKVGRQGGGREGEGGQHHPGKIGRRWYHGEKKAMGVHSG